MGPENPRTVELSVPFPSRYYLHSEASSCNEGGLWVLMSFNFGNCLEHDSESHFTDENPEADNAEGGLGRSLLNSGLPDSGFSAPRRASSRHLMAPRPLMLRLCMSKSRSSTVSYCPGKEGTHLEPAAPLDTYTPAPTPLSWLGSHPTSETNRKLMQVKASVPQCSYL